MTTTEPRRQSIFRRNRAAAVVFVLLATAQVCLPLHAWLRGGRFGFGLYDGKSDPLYAYTLEQNDGSRVRVVEERRYKITTLRDGEEALAHSRLLEPRWPLMAQRICRAKPATTRVRVTQLEDGEPVGAVPCPR